VKRKNKVSLEDVQALIHCHEATAHTQEAVDKFSEIVIAPHGLHDGPDEIVVMGYFDFIEGYELDDDDEPTDEPALDLSLEELGFALEKLGIRICSEGLTLDEATGKLIP